MPIERLHSRQQFVIVTTIDQDLHTGRFWAGYGEVLCHSSECHGNPDYFETIETSSVHYALLFASCT